MRGTQKTKGADLAVWGSTCDNGAWRSDYNSRDWLFLNWTEKVRIESYSWIFASLCGTYRIQTIPDFFCPKLKILTLVIYGCGMILFQNCTVPNRKIKEKREDRNEVVHCYLLLVDSLVILSAIY